MQSIGMAPVTPHTAQILSERAAQMRVVATRSEALLWARLRAKQLGVAFQRQIVIGPFIVDFVAPSVRLIVEVDGGCHARRSRADARRDRKLRRAGYRVLRLEAGVVEQHIEQAVAVVRDALQAKPP
jgi:very-short-patch-repair endonuclease